MTAPGSFGVASSPWTAKQRLVLGALLAIGVIGLTAGYAGTSGRLRVSDQVVWVNVAGAALLVSGAGVVAFLTAGRRAIGRRRLGLFDNVIAGETATVDVASSVSAAELVAAPTMTKYHRAGCSFVVGKSGVVALTAVGHHQSGRRPCGVCLPSGNA